MAYVPEQLAQNAENSTSETTIYTVPASTTTIVKQIVLANTTGSAATYSMSIVPAGGTAGNGNRIMESQSLPANSVTAIDVTQVMGAGDFISIKQGAAAAVTCTVSGVETGTMTEGLAVRKNSGSVVGTRSQLNLIEGTNVTLTVADDSGAGEVDVTIAASGGGGGKTWTVAQSTVDTSVSPAPSSDTLVNNLSITLPDNGSRTVYVSAHTNYAGGHPMRIRIYRDSTIVYPASVSSNQAGAAVAASDSGNYQWDASDIPISVTGANTIEVRWQAAGSTAGITLKTCYLIIKE